MIEKFIEQNDKKIHRLLEMTPGVLTWLFMLSPLWLGLIAPQVVVWLLTFLSLYWAYLGAKFTIGLMVGYKKYRKELAVDWLEECKKLDFAQLPDKETLPASLAETKHFILVPIVNEPYEVLKPPLEAFMSQTFPTKQITLVYSVEERFADVVEKTIYQILGDKKDIFEEVLIFRHPAGIAGEAIGSGAGNRTWGAKHAVEHLIQNGKEIKNYIFTTFDADHVPHVQYMARLAHLYLNTDRRNNKFYATNVHLFDNNHWEVPSMMRFEANFVTLGTLANRSIEWGLEPLTKDTFAAYSASLQTLIDAEYWDVGIGVDDTVFFWRAFFKRDGDFKGATHFIPYSADAVQGKTYLQSYISLYKQLLRWGWGVVVVPLSVQGFLKNKKVPLNLKITWILKHFKLRVVLINISFLITFGFAILTYVNKEVRQTNFAYSLPDVMSMVLTGALIFIVPGSIVRARIVKPMPKDWPLWKKALALLEGPLAIINLLTYSFFPFIEAQTRMLLGKKMKDLYHTPKVR